jgi:hypothetical protein
VLVPLSHAVVGSHDNREWPEQGVLEWRLLVLGLDGKYQGYWEVASLAQPVLGAASVTRPQATA